MMNVHFGSLHSSCDKGRPDRLSLNIYFCHSSNASSKRLAVFRRRRFPVISHSPSRAAGFPPAQAR
jgi:hypothetical protein